MRLIVPNIFPINSLLLFSCFFAKHKQENEKHYNVSSYAAGFKAALKKLHLIIWKYSYPV